MTDEKTGTCSKINLTNRKKKKNPISLSCKKLALLGENIEFAIFRHWHILEKSILQLIDDCL